MPSIVCILLWRPDWPPIWQVDPFVAFFFRLSITNISSGFYSKLKSNDFLFNEILFVIDFQFHLLSVAMGQKHLSHTHYYSFDPSFLVQAPLTVVAITSSNSPYQAANFSFYILFKICSTHPSQMPNKLVY